MRLSIGADLAGEGLPGERLGGGDHVLAERDLPATRSGTSKVTVIVEVSARVAIVFWRGDEIADRDVGQADRRRRTAPSWCAWPVRARPLRGRSRPCRTAVSASDRATAVMLLDLASFSARSRVSRRRCRERSAPGRRRPSGRRRRDGRGHGRCARGARFEGDLGDHAGHLRIDRHFAGGGKRADGANLGAARVDVDRGGTTAGAAPPPGAARRPPPPAPPAGPAHPRCGRRRRHSPLPEPEALAGPGDGEPPVVAVLTPRIRSAVRTQPSRPGDQKSRGATEESALSGDMQAKPGCCDQPVWNVARQAFPSIGADDRPVDSFCRIVNASEPIRPT